MEDQHQSAAEKTGDDKKDVSSLLPISESKIICGHSKAISALDIEPSGARIVSGSHDHRLKFWDFNGMGAAIQPYRDVEPYEGHYIRDLKWNSSGSHILMASASGHAKLYDRNGFEQREYEKGDVYLVDLRNTTGHTGSLTSIAWKPFDNDKTFITSGNDSTVRIWDVEVKRKQKDLIIIKPNGAAGVKGTSKLHITTASFDPFGKLIYTMGIDGTLRIFDSKGPFHRPTSLIENCHVNGSETGSIAFNTLGNLFLTRSTDDTLKLWDSRKLSTAIAVKSDLTNYFAESNACFSPNDKFVLCGTSANKKNEGGNGCGKMLILNSLDFLTVYSEEIVESGKNNCSVIKCLWHPNLNQIVVGCGNGSFQAFYSQNLSQKGAMLIGRHEAPKVKDMALIDAESHTFSPRDLGVYKKDSLKSYYQKRAARLKDPLISKKPDMPPKSVPGKGGAVGTSVAAEMLKTIDDAMIGDGSKQKEEDPREEILKYAKLAEEVPYWVAPAYAKTQPKAIYATNLAEAEAEDELKRKMRQKEKENKY